MSRPCPRAVLLLLLALGCAGLRADLVPDLNAVRLPVPDRSAAALADARREGLEVALLRLSGERAALAHPEIAAALRRPQRYLVQYSYRDDGEDGDDGLSLRLEYDAPALRGLLRAAGLPLWTANRPPVLTFLVVNDGRQRRFASAAELPAAGAALRAQFRRRGLPLRLPLYDLQDRLALPLGAAWRQDSAALVDAALRYDEDVLLAGRVARLSDGRWLGDWRILQAGRWQVEPVSADSLADFAAAGADLAARSLVARYAVVAAADGDLRLRVAVEGIADFAAYRRVRGLLQALEPVDRVAAERVEAGRVLLRLESAAQAEPLARIIELDPRFQRRAAAPGEAALRYRWRE